MQNYYPTTLFDFSLDTKLAIINLLDNRSLTNLSETCTYFATLSRSIRSFREAYVATIQKSMPTSPPFLNFRAGVAIGMKFYLPFIGAVPFCYIFDLNMKEWSTRKLKVDGFHEIHSQVTSAASIGNKIYLVGGRLLKSYTLSNSLIEIDTDSFIVRVIKNVKGTPPRPRHEHSVDTIGDRYLVVFGGLCYNSVGENDIFVYDSFENTWSVPHTYGQFPHLRFGHSSTVIGKNLYIHGGAQIDSDSSYIIYDDLYKLDCKNWVWYKYEHPEVEKYMRCQPLSSKVPFQREYSIQTTGDNPHDRFQAYMCASAGKLIIFGGHSIRMDEDDNEVLCDYTLDEIYVFNTRRQHWSAINAHLLHKEDEEFMTVSNISAALLPVEHRGLKLFIFAGKKVFIAGKRPSALYTHEKSSSSGSSNSLIDTCRGEMHHESDPLQSIMEYDSKNAEDDTDIRECTKNHTKIENTEEGQFKIPDNSKHSEIAKNAFRLVDTDVQNNLEDINQLDGEGNSHEPMIAPSVNNTALKTNNSSMPYSSGSFEETSRMRRQNRVTPCIVMFDLLE